VVLFEMVTGQLPFRGEHEAAIVYSIVNEEPRPVTDFAKDAPAGLADIFAKAFEKDPNERYQSAADLAVDLKRLKKQSSTHSRSRASIPVAGTTQGRPASSAGTPTGTDRPGTSETPVSPSGRMPLPLIATAVLLIAALSYIAYIRLSAPVPGDASAMTFGRLTDLAGAETWPDISPDGNYIVYVKPAGETSDIYLQRIGGGNPINLTAGSATVNTQPEYSPEGDLIAFRSGRDGGGIFVMGSTGESVRRLTDFGFNPTWTPDGKTILFQTEYLEHPYSRGTTSQIWSVDVEDGKTTKLFAGDGVQPRLSPDGKTVLFWGLPPGTGKRELWTMPAGGGEPKRLTDDDAIDWNPVWTSDGRGIYFLSTRGGTMNLWRFGYDPGTGSVTGPPEPHTLPTQNCTGFRLSRDGKKFIYLSTERRSNVFRVPYDPAARRITGGASQVTEGSREFNYLSISPDGKSIAFTLGGIQEDIGVMGLEGRDFRKLTNDRFKDRGPKWSHDGKRIAFYSERSGTYQIWTVNTDGSGIEPITEEKGSGLVSWPNWMPGDRSIYYQTDSGGAFVELAGSPGKRKTIRVRPAEGLSFFSGNSVSADGKSILGAFVKPDGTGGPLVIYSLADSSYRKLGEEGIGALWCADNRTILFIGIDRNLKSLDIQTGAVIPLEGLPRFTDYSEFCLTPDNRSIYFIRVETETDAWEASLKAD
jgi:Tol biopolymer transport system component